MRGARLTATEAAHRFLTPSTGLEWPRRGRRAVVSDAERARLLHYERLMGLAHLAVVPLALAATVVHLDFATGANTPWFGGLLAIVVVYALAYHFLVPRVWLSHTKVVVGLCVDTVLVTEVVRLTGYHMSLLVFLYYLIVIASALTLETRALYGICLVVSACFVAVLPVDPLFVRAPHEHAAHVILFVASVWLVGLLSAAAAAQIQAAERRLLAAMRAQQAVAEENAALSASLTAELAASRALAASLKREREETRRLADMVIRAQEEERGRVARELHDEANQTLAALMTTIDAVEAVGRGCSPELAASLARLRRLAAAALGDLHRIATELRPPALDEFGLVPALTRHVRDRTEGTGMRATVTVEGRRRRIPPAVEVALYRIAQEALANAQKHSGATEVTVRLRHGRDRVELEVTDNGCGFVPEPGPAEDRRGLGIAGMRERASIVGGVVEVISAPGRGTRVVASVPLTPVVQQKGAA